jgi:aryl-alcohol dehydrogenase-like predicted oxidoreductase
MLRIGQMRPKRCALFGRSLFGHGLLAEVGTKYGTEDHRARKWITMRPLVNSALAELQKRGIDSPAAIREALIAHALSAGVIDVALLGSTRPSQVLENVAAAERAARLTDIIAAVEDVINSSA